MLDCTPENVRLVFDRTAEHEPDLWGCGLLDLMADNVGGSLDDIRRALVASTIGEVCNDRLRESLESYRREI